MDRLSAQQRSKLMSRVRQKNTGPEVVVRKMLHGLGYRFRLHRRDLPGSPDIVLPRYSAVIFVDGCFWHGHACRAGNVPSSRSEYWAPKIAANHDRDIRQTLLLQRLGWRVLRVPTCQIKDGAALQRRLKRFLKKI